MSSRSQRQKRLSQNSIRKRSVARRIVAQSSVRPGDLALEIGPGKGILTCELARFAREVIAVEKDPHFAKAARERVKAFSNVEVVQCDFLQFDLPSSEYKVVANIPFNSTAAIIERLAGADEPPDDAYFVVQREAAERFIGVPQTTLVSVLLLPWYSFSIVDRFRRSDFIPQPKVDTVLLRMKRRDTPLIDAAASTIFRDFITYGFTAWEPNIGIAYRKVLLGRARSALKDAKIDTDLRPSQIPTEEWLRLFMLFYEYAPERSWRVLEGTHDRLKAQQAKLKKLHRTRTARGH